LLGSPQTVIGATDQVSGEIRFDLANPAQSQLGTILINARTFATDSDRRDRAIQNQILDTNSYEFISFEPTQIEGLPASVALGDSVTLQVHGNLTIRAITKPVTFEVTVTPSAEGRLEGSGSTTVMRADYELTIPNVPSVAGVDEEVLLEIDFVATS
jgi:polyisoprenoid-binding protein YceI